MLGMSQSSYPPLTPYYKVTQFLGTPQKIAQSVRMNI